MFIKAFPAWQPGPVLKVLFFSPLHPFNHHVVSLMKFGATTCKKRNLHEHRPPHHPIWFSPVRHCQPNVVPAQSCLMVSPTRTAWAGAWETFPRPIYSRRHLLAGTPVPLSSETLRTWAERLEFSLTAFAGSKKKIQDTGKGGVAPKSRNFYISMNWSVLKLSSKTILQIFHILVNIFPLTEICQYFLLPIWKPHGQRSHLLERQAICISAGSMSWGIWRGMSWMGAGVRGRVQ